MLDKAKREHARLVADFHMDHVFNFFITVNHVRDYVEKTGEVPQKALDDLYTESVMKDCRDICDKAKHFTLTKRPDLLTNKWNGALGEAPLNVMPLAGEGEWQLWRGDRVISIGSLAVQALARWSQFFEDNGL